MQYTRSRPPSPSGTSRMRQGHIDNGSSTTGLSAMRGPHTPLSTPSPELSDSVDMLSKDKEKLQPTLEIVVTNDVLYLKGPGTDVEPTLLSGNVVLHLPEAIPIKDITLHFRGKVRLPPSNDS